MKALSPWSIENTKDPRKENIWDMFRFSFCARSRMLSFVVIMILILTVVFIIQLSVDGVNRSGDLAQVNAGSNTTIYKWLNLSGIKVYGQYQIWRMLSCIFLHYSMQHILFNI